MLTIFCALDWCKVLWHFSRGVSTPLSLSLWLGYTDKCPHLCVRLARDAVLCCFVKTQSRQKLINQKEPNVHTLRLRSEEFYIFATADLHRGEMWRTYTFAVFPLLAWLPNTLRTESHFSVCLFLSLLLLLSSFSSSSLLLLSSFLFSTPMAYSTWSLFSAVLHFM